jgi:hypothetical protein
MSRLVEFPTPELDAMYDALPFRGKLAIMSKRFDEWVRGNGAQQCIGCERVVRDIGGACGECWLTQEKR